MLSSMTQFFGLSSQYLKHVAYYLCATIYDSKIAATYLYVIDLPHTKSLFVSTKDSLLKCVPLVNRRSILKDALNAVQSLHTSLVHERAKSF